jgi:hypothetical protein
MFGSGGVAVAAWVIGAALAVMAGVLGAAAALVAPVEQPRAASPEVTTREIGIATIERCFTVPRLLRRLRRRLHEVF